MPKKKTRFRESATSAGPATTQGTSIPGNSRLGALIPRA